MCNLMITILIAWYYKIKSNYYFILLAISLGHFHIFSNLRQLLISPLESLISDLRVTFCNIIIASKDRKHAFKGKNILHTEITFIPYLKRDFLYVEIQILFLMIQIPTYYGCVSIYYLLCN